MKLRYNIIWCSRSIKHFDEFVRYRVSWSGTVTRYDAHAIYYCLPKVPVGLCVHFCQQHVCFSFRSNCVPLVSIYGRGPFNSWWKSNRIACWRIPERSRQRRCNDRRVWWHHRWVVTDRNNSRRDALAADSITLWKSIIRTMRADRWRGG